jgi:chorismate dehydratase
VYDLSEAWKALTGLPFVFAAWVSVKELSATFIDEFDAANERGLFELVRLSNQWALPGVDMLNYYTQLIHYILDDQKKSGMERFLSMIQSVPLP